MRSWILAGLLVAALAVAGWQTWRAQRLADDVGARQAVVEAAGAFAESLLSYDHQDLDAAREDVLEHATGDFARTYEEAFEETLGTVISELEAVATAEVREVYVSDIQTGTAKAVVVVDSEVESSAGRRELTGAYLQVDLVRQDGRWLVDEATSVSAEGEELVPSGS